MPGIEPRSELEKAIMSDPRWQAGARWGKPRPGHPEGRVESHIEDVLANIDRLDPEPGAREKLRIIALVHDTFKNEVDVSLPKAGENHHAMIARRFVEQYTQDSDVLEITELHDEAYNSWGVGERRGDWAKAEARGRRLLARLGSRLSLYMAFYRADTETGDKNTSPLDWFNRLVAQSAPELELH